MTADQVWNELKNSKDYRDFLANYLRLRQLSLSDFARATGFGRGFPGDVISGKRRLTAKSSIVFERSLKLPPTGRRLFRLLVALKEEDTYPELERKDLAHEISHLRAKRLVSPRRIVLEEKIPARILLRPHALAVLAACGEPNSWTTLEAIMERTQLPAQRVISLLKDLQGAQFIFPHATEARFKPSDEHIHIEPQQQSELFVQIFKKATEEAAEKAKTSLGSQEELFFNSTLCVRKENVPELKKALGDVILKFIDSATDSEGERLIKLVVGLHF